MIEKVREYIGEKGLLSYGGSVVVGLSGGADSVCLFRILISLREEYGISLYAVHVNHGIRGAEAARDECFSVALAEKYGVQCAIYRYDVPLLSDKWKITEEEAGRRVRYEAFETELGRRGGGRIAVAHHKNDQAETILFRMCRGTGIKGMAGIPARRGNIIRPLLCVGRNEIEMYLEGIGQDYVLDATNEIVRYDRNRLRKYIIPETEKINSSAVSHICEMAERISGVYEWYEDECERLYGELVSHEGNSLKINAGELCSLNGAAAAGVVRKMIERLASGLKDIENRHIKGILGLAGMQSGKEIHLPYSVIAERQYEYIRLYRDCGGQEEPGSIIIIDMDKITADGREEYTLHDIYMPNEKKYADTLKITFGMREYNVLADTVPKNDCTKWFDCGKIKGKLVLRRPGDNDYYIIGDSHTKKVSRYMIDEKIPRQYRDRIFVLAEGDNILYIVGGRTGSGCYVDGDTGNILEITLQY